MAHGSFGQINSTYTWSTRHLRCVALRCTQTWGVTRDGQGYHHLSPTAQPKGMNQTKVTSSLDTMSMLSTTTLALHRVICLYLGPSI
jgi:hypothetical protein